MLGRSKFVLALCASVLIGCSAGAEKAVEMKSESFYLPLRVLGDTFHQTFTEMKQLAKYAEDQKLNQNVQLFLRTAVEKMSTAIVEAKKKQEDVGPAAFTEGFLKVRDLKKASQAKKCNIKKYTVDELKKQLEKKKLKMSEPFIIVNGTSNLLTLQRKLTAEELKKKKTKIQYFTPKQAKDRMTGQDVDVFKPEMITFERYFSNCFGNARTPGAQTEHCENVVRLSTVDKDLASSYSLDTVTSFAGNFQRLEAMRLKFVETGRAEFSKMLEADDEARFYDDKVDDASTSMVLGASGSGASMEQTQLPVADALVHGHRRWFMMRPGRYQSLRHEAGENFYPASAFMFFEEQYAELKEDHGLKEKDFWECNQQEGDIVWVPSDLMKMALNLKDSVSYRAELLTDVKLVNAYAEAKIWQPQMQQYSLAFCHGPDGLDELKGWVHPQQKTGVAQAMKKQFKTGLSENPDVLSVLVMCYGILGLDPDIPAEKTICAKAWKQCTARLQRNLKKLSLPWPSFIPSTIEAATKKAKDEL